jgi:hypothetical protein
VRNINKLYDPPIGLSTKCKAKAHPLTPQDEINTWEL